MQDQVKTSRTWPEYESKCEGWEVGMLRCLNGCKIMIVDPRLEVSVI